jgi:hypothetical protein
MFLCLINLTLCHEDVWQIGGIPPSFLTSALDEGESSALCIGCFNPGKELPVVFDKRLGGPQIWSGHYGDEINFFPLTEIEPRASQPAARRYTD